MKVSSRSRLKTRSSNRLVNLSGVFMDDVGDIKGLTVIRVVPEAKPMDERPHESTPVDLESEGQIGIMDPFWWQHDENVGADISPTGGALTCIVALDDTLELDEPGWLKKNAKIARPEAYLEKPVQLADGKTIGKIVNEKNHLALGQFSVYPLLKLQRSKNDREEAKEPRNGAMVFAQDHGMIGIIVAVFGNGEYYSVAPISDVMEWHRLRFLDQAATERTEDIEEDPALKAQISRHIQYSSDLEKLLED